MTGTEVGVETQAQRIADRGRDALVNRLRSAYGDARAAHADLISFDDARIEAMVQSAADRADGLQWRRALADVASDELGVSPTEALSHPAVARALGLVGAPSYEQSLADLAAQPVPPAAPVGTPGPEQASVARGLEPLEPEHAAETEPPAENEPEHAAEIESEPAAENEPAHTAEIESEPAADADPAAAPTAGDTSEATAEPVPGVEPPQEPHAPRSVSDLDSELPPTSEHHMPVDIAKSWPTHAARGNQSQVADELETVEADDTVLELLPEPEPTEFDTEDYDVGAISTGEQTKPEPEPEPVAAEPEPHAAPAETDATDAADLAGGSEPGSEEAPAAETVAEDAPSYGRITGAPQPQHQPEVVVPAIHLGGVANLPTKREGLSVRLSADGLDILQGGDGDILGRLIWDEIETLEVPNVRVRLRHKPSRARLVVRTPYGDASFDVPGMSVEELRDRVEPLIRIYGVS